jgi:hypothetical protein
MSYRRSYTVCLKVIFLPLRQYLVLGSSCVPEEVDVNVKENGNKPAKEL